MVCPSIEELKQQAEWDGAEGTSRTLLLSELSSKVVDQTYFHSTKLGPESISPSVMIPNHRLAILLDQVKQSQISKCHYHNPTVAPSLFSDHLCDRSQFPLQTVRTLSQSEGEIWYLAFSPDGSMLATSGFDKSVIVYDTATFEEKYNLADHTKAVPYLAWSPDGSGMITCSQDHTAKIWDMTVR